MYYSIHTYQSTESTKITGETQDSRPKMEYNVHISKLVSILFLTYSFGYIAFEKQIQQHFSKCKFYLIERELDQRRERPVEREGERRELDVPPP